MSVQHTKQGNTSPERIREASILELQKMVATAKKVCVQWTDMLTILAQNSSRLEIMLLDSAFKGLPLERQDRTLLIPPAQYIELVQTATAKLVDLIQNKSHLLPKRIFSE